MTGGDAVLACVGLLGLAMSAFFAAAEGAISRVNQARVRERAEQGTSSSVLMARLLEDPHSLITVTQVGTLLSLVISGYALTVLAMSLQWAASIPAAAGLTIAVLTALVLLPLGVIPRAVVRDRAERSLEAMALPLTGFWLVMQPLERGLRLLISLFSRVLGIRWQRTPGPVSKDQVLEFAEHVEREGMLEIDERKMIQRILSLHRTRVHEIMRPLIKVVAIRESEVSAERLAEIARLSGHSRFPVYRTAIIDLTGHIDIYQALSGEPKTADELRAMIQPAFYVPEMKRVDDLLQEMLRERQRVAIAIDEYGSCSGIATLEDILEEIFGEIADEFDRERPRWVANPNGSALIEATADLDDLNTHFGLAIPKEGCNTLGGFVYDRLGRVPRVGDVVRHGGHTLRVQEMNGQRIVIILMEPAAGDAA